MKNLLLIIYLISIGYKKIPYKTKNNIFIFYPIIILFIIVHTITPHTLGKANEELTWSSWRNPRNIYISFNDSNKSLKISGLYELEIYILHILKPQLNKMPKIENLKVKHLVNQVNIKINIPEYLKKKI